jgi:hypothetical protein
MQIQDHDEFPKFDHRVLPPASRRSLGDSVRPPAIPGMPGMAGSHENWGNFKCHKWGEYGRHSHKETGREGLPAESVLRCALLKQHRQLSYEELALVPSRFMLELAGASSGDMRLSDHAARSMI